MKMCINVKICIINNNVLILLIMCNKIIMIMCNEVLLLICNNNIINVKILLM